MIKFREVHGRGFGCFLDNFTIRLDGLGLVLVLGKNHDTTSADNNGAGKTTIFKAITWCCFGEFVDGDKTLEVIHTRAKSAEVGVVFYDDEAGVGYCVTRKQTRSGQQLELESTGPDGWVSQKGKDKRQTQARIEAILGMDYHAWCNTVLFGQTAANRFADRGIDDKTRKQLLKRVFGLEIIDDAKEVVLAKLRDMRHDIDRANGQATLLRRELEGIDIDGIKARQLDFETRRETRERNLREQAATMRKKAEATKPSKKAIAALNKKLAEAENQRKTLKEATLAKPDVISAKKAAMDQVEALRNTASELKARFTALDAQIGHLVGDKCPLCTSPLTKGDGKKHKEALINEADGLRQEHEGVINELGEANAQLGECRVKLEAIRDAETTLGTLTGQVAAWRAELAAQESAGKAAQELSESATQLEAQASEVAAEHNPFTDMLSEAKRQLAKAKADLKTAEDEAQALNDDALYFEFWNKAFSDQGLISFIIDSILPLLNRLTNDKLQTLSDGDISVMYDSESLLRTGEVRDKISLNTVIEGLPNVTPSGAQHKKISLATALALMDLVASRHDKQLDLQLLDEPFDALDKPGKQRAITMLHKQQERKGTILVTSHDPDVVGAFTKRLLVERKAGETTVVES